MKVIKTTAEYTIVQKRNNRYGVKSTEGKWINSEEKVKILLAEDLIKVTEPAAAEEPAAEEADASEEAPAEESAE